MEQKKKPLESRLKIPRAYIPWREDIFDGWDFYDMSHSTEFKLKGYDIVFPAQSYAWCLHDDRVALNLLNYNYYRKKFIKEYGDYYAFP